MFPVITLFFSCNDAVITLCEMYDTCMWDKTRMIESFLFFFFSNAWTWLLIWSYLTGYHVNIYVVIDVTSHVCIPVNSSGHNWPCSQGFLAYGMSYFRIIKKKNASAQFCPTISAFFSLSGTICLLTEMWVGITGFKNFIL